MKRMPSEWPNLACGLSLRSQQNQTAAKANSSTAVGRFTWRTSGRQEDVLQPAGVLEPEAHLEGKDRPHAVPVEGKPGRRRRFHPLDKDICGSGDRPEVSPPVAQLRPRNTRWYRRRDAGKTDARPKPGR